MGIVNENATFICEAKRAGTVFGDVLTLGRQNLYISSSHLRALARELHVDELDVKACDGQLFADDFIRLFLHAKTLTALDNSDFEGAEIVHDLNTPLPARFEQRYDTIIDGGALEHIFNFPVALANCMRLLKPGGRFFLGAPANNQLGHGFYQFSPELFFRCFSENSGFELERMYAIEMKYMGGEFGAHGKPVVVNDPERVGERVSLANSKPVHLMIQARKLRHLSEPFASIPQQSDYVRAWKDAAGAPLPRPPASLARRIARKVVHALPRSVRERVINEYGRHYVHTFRNRKFYSRP